MAALTKKEILAELRKLGIDSTSEINSYYREYKEYSVKYSQTFFTGTLRRIRRQSLQKRNVNSPPFSKEKASKLKRQLIAR